MNPTDGTASTPQRSASSGARWEPPPPEQLQALLQGYEVIELLGRGGMGAVYKARQISLDRMVAIKILPPALWDDETNFVDRFRNEARVMGRLSHPGMIAVHDFGETADGQLYFVMEFVDGTDVSKMIVEQGRLPPAHALAIAAHVCDVLQYAHEHDVIHRDIKPANVMVDMEGRVKVADFGLAKLTSHDSGLTRSSMAMGTPDFIAPEALIIGITVDARADLFSLGVMFYQMLTGKVPRGVFAPPSECVPDLDTRFDDIVTRAMQSDRERRYQSTVQFRHDLDHILTVPIVKTEPSPAEVPRTKRVMHRAAQVAPPSHRSVPWGLLAAGLVALGGVSVFFYFKNSGKARQNEPLADGEPKIATSPAPPAPAVTPQPKPADITTTTAPTNTTATPAVQPAVSVAVVTPMPVAPPPQKPATETTTRLDELEAQFKAAYEREVTKVRDAAVADLDTKYVAALDRAFAAATSAGKLPEALALREEKKRVEDHQPLPADDAADAPDSLKSLRATYRESLARFDSDRDKKSQPLFEKYDQVLAALQTELTKAGKLDEALEVTSKQKLISGVRSTVSSGQPGQSPGIQPGARLAKVEVEDAVMTPLEPDALLYGNSNRVKWTVVPPCFKGFQFTKFMRLRSTNSATVRFKVESDGMVLMSCTQRWGGGGSGGTWQQELVNQAQLEAQGWKLMDSAAGLRDIDECGWLVFARLCKTGEQFSYRTEKYVSPVILVNPSTGKVPAELTAGSKPQR